MPSMSQSKICLLLLTIAGVQSQRINVTLSGPTDLEYGKSSQFICKWDLTAADLAVLALQPEEPVQLTWLFNDKVIYTIAERDGYTPIGSFETNFADRTDVSAEFNYANSTSTLTINSAALTDAGSYRCRVKLAQAKQFNGNLGYASGSATSTVEIFAQPNITFNEAVLEFDTREAQYIAYKAGLISLDSNDTNTVSPVLVPTYEMGSCSIKNAFPAPQKIELYVGESVKSEAGDLTVVTNADGLFDVEFNFKVELNGASDDGSEIYCKSSDNGKWAATSETEDKMLVVKYLPTDLSVQYSVSEAATDSIFEGDTVQVSCVANGNPQVEISLNNAAENSTTFANGTTVLADVSRDNSDSFQCLIEGVEGYEEFVMESDAVQLSVNYLDSPKITIVGAQNGDGEVAESIPKIVDLKGTAQINCIVDSRPNATFEWFKRDTNGGDWVSISKENQGKLKLENINYDAMGDYKCAAQNGGVVKESGPLTVHVYGECVITDVTAKHEVKTNGDEQKNKVTFTCNIDQSVFPECSVKWIYEKSVFGKGRANSNKLVFEDFNLPDEINAVTCQAENAYRTFATIRAMSAEAIRANIKIEESGINTTYILIGGVILALLVIGFCYKKNKKSSPPEAAEENNKLNADMA